MKVILLQDVRGIGRKHELKEVSDGYARNFLFANHLAKPGTTSALKELGAMKNKMTSDERELKKHLEELARKINGTTIVFTLKADVTGAVFGSVNKDAILKSLREQKLIGNERVEVELDHPLKEIGDHRVSVNLKKGIFANLGVTLEPISK